MKKIVFLIMCLTFSMSVSAHQPTTTFQHQIASKAFAMESSQMYTSGNGGILQLIYNAFYKVGNMISTTLSNEEVPKDEETTTEN
jgi:expansin (peptidoglycan-binding protein)